MMRHPALLMPGLILCALVWNGITYAPPTQGDRRDLQAASPTMNLPIALPNAPPATPVPTATPLPAPDPVFTALEQDLYAMVAGWPGEHAVSLADLQTGRTISVNGQRPQMAACTIKIPIIVAVAQDIEAGYYTEADVAGLVESAMGPSNTAPARDLLQLTGRGDIGAGLQRANQIMAGLGASASIMTHPPGYYWEEYGYASVDNLLTSDDLVRMLRTIYQGAALSPWATGYVLQSMTIAPDWMDASLGSPLPPEVELYHKVGQLYEPHNTWNDAGIIVFERNGQKYAYVIAYLGSYGASWEDAYAHAMSVSERAWAYFGNLGL